MINISSSSQSSSRSLVPSLFRGLMSSPTIILVTLNALVFASLILVFLYSEQRFRKLEEQLGAKEQQGIARGNSYASPEKSGTSAAGGEDQIDALSLIRATFGFVTDEGGIIIKTARLDWQAAAKVQEIRIFNDQGGALIAITSKEENAFIPPPYIVGSVPDGFVVKEGQSFETLAAGKTYRAELKGRVDKEPFEVGFNFNIP